MKQLTHPPVRPNRRATALMVTILVISLTAVMVISIIDTQTLQLTALRNTLEYEKAGYLATAAVEAACAELEASTVWRTGISSTEFPSGSGNTYSATAVSSTGTLVIITGTGIAGSCTRKLSVTIDTNG